LKIPASQKSPGPAKPAARQTRSPLPLPSALAEGLADFLEALRVEAGLARNTLLAYRSDVTRFLAYAVERGVAEWDGIGPDHLVGHLAALRAAGLAEATVARALAAVRMALRHQVSEGRLARDPSVLFSAPHLAHALPVTLSVEHVERLLAAPQGRGWQALRDRALLETLYAVGARVSEAVGLTVDALTPSLGVLQVTGKGRKTRVVPLGARARAALEEWLSLGRPRVPGAERERAVFLTRSGRPMTRTDAWRRVKRAVLQAGIDARVSPHTLRHSFASHLVEGGADLRSVQEMLGHASIRTTEIYAHLDAEHVQSLHRLYHPRA
jgi:integrase/recombinase XerD